MAPGPPHYEKYSAPQWPRSAFMSHYFEKISTLKFDEIEKISTLKNSTVEIFRN
jgi:hypothetical protein